MEEHFRRLYELVSYLRSEKGCPWDRVQTLETIKPHLIEEIYEVSEAIDEGDIPKLREELGDILFLILFSCRIAEEEGKFSVADVLTSTHDKMKSRHPHVFKKQQDLDPHQVVDEWQRAKRDERKKKTGSVLGGLPRTLPALLRAQRIQERAASLGFDWEDIKDVFEKLREEIGEFEEAWQNAERDRIVDELGDILFSIVNLARFLKIDAEDALRRTSDKFCRRFEKVENAISKQGKMTLEEMDKIWEKSKESEP